MVINHEIAILLKGEYAWSLASLVDRLSLEGGPIDYKEN